jgi:HK97 family phage prohead protease
MFYKKTASTVETSSGRRLKFIASTESPDRDLDVILVAGWQLDNYLKNPVVLLNHKHDGLPVAKAVDLFKDTAKRQLVATVEFPPDGVYPLSDTVYKLAKAGFINAVSVGFNGLESQPRPEGRGRIYTKQELYEISIVGVPAQPEALQTAVGKGIISSCEKSRLEKAFEFDLASIKLPKNKDIRLEAIPCPPGLSRRMKYEIAWADELEKIRKGL